ncbi:MAG: prephenate dehydrogenase/arogenate dehydrogenase family protein [Gammaproteobacteria bacterium]|nr:prephenate dehydrogenase/arogenate dehydrogenase family protein [Gammaproteobacteria bacterium]
MIQQLSIIGIGLIGGSLALALKQAGAVARVTAYARRQETLDQALALGAIDYGSTDLGEAMAGAEVVVVATPVGAMPAMFEQLAPHLTDDMVLTDVGSTKGSVVRAASMAIGQLPVGFVPGHPIAGTEQNGVGAAFADLYKNRRIILTPLQSSHPDAIATVRQMWEACGAEVVEMGVEHHDEVLAATSHLPHMLAYALVDTLARMDESEEIFEFAAGGFRDFTRIASSNPAMWHDICVANREAMLSVLNRFSEDLAQLTAAIEAGNSDYLLQTFTRAKGARDRFAEKFEDSNT